MKIWQHLAWAAIWEEPVGEILNEIQELADWLVMSKPKKSYLDEVDAVYSAFMDEWSHDIPTDYKNLDKILGGWYETGNMVVVAARPSVGKTALMLNMALNMAMNKEIKGKVWFFSLEMKNRDLIKRTISKLSGINSYLLRKKYDELEKWQQTMISWSYDKVAALDLNLVDNDFFIESIVSTAKSKHMKEPYACIYIDYLGIIDTRKSFGWNIPNKVGHISREIKRLGMELDIPIIVWCQLNREIEKRRDPEPKLSDLRDSWSIEQDADTVMFITREETMQDDIESMMIYVKKQRNGATGDIELEMHMPTGNIYTPQDKWADVYKPRETRDGMF